MFEPMNPHLPHQGPIGVVADSIASAIARLLIRVGTLERFLAATRSLDEARAAALTDDALATLFRDGQT
jgi:hypothetical protein